MKIAKRLSEASRYLCRRVERMRFRAPVAYVYNPLSYAREPHEAYLERYGDAPKRVVFLGMNPGPWGMAQTGIPFGEVHAAKVWMGIEAPVGMPKPAAHPKRPILGFACDKSEVSGRRLWGLFRERFGDAESFFAEHFVLNYCPLVFMEESSRNRTPDKLPTAEAQPLFEACDDHLRQCIDILEPEWIVGIGGFAQKRAAVALDGRAAPKRAKLLHPSPASPAANRGWAEAATRQLADQGVWPAIW